MWLCRSNLWSGNMFYVGFSGVKIVFNTAVNDTKGMSICCEVVIGKTIGVFLKVKGVVPGVHNE